MPTPVAVFAIREVGAAAGLVVTASHNPPADNGLKLYGADAAQIVPPVDALVAAAIDAVAADTASPRRAASPATVAPLGAAVVDAYPPPPSRASRRRRRRSGSRRPPCTASAGRCSASCWRRRATPTSTRWPPRRRPTRPSRRSPSPTPRSPGPPTCSPSGCARPAPPIGLALDPDADRIGVLVAPPGGEPRRLTGDDVGALLGEWLLAEVTSGPRAAGRVERRVVVAAGPRRRGPRGRPRRDADRLQVAVAARDGAPGAGPGAGLRGGPRLRDRRRRARQGRPHRGAGGGLAGRRPGGPGADAARRAGRPPHAATGPTSPTTSRFATRPRAATPAGRPSSGAWRPPRRPGSAASA